MDIGIDDAINYFYGNSSFDMIYYEAVANALDANANRIDIAINIPSFSNPERMQIEIKDNGKGFNEENFHRFSSLLKRKDSNHKGLGRLVYLKYFQSVEVESVYENRFRRVFIFDGSFSGDNNVEEVEGLSESFSKLKFTGFNNIRLKAYSQVTPSSIKQSLLNIFMPRLFLLKKNKREFSISITTKTEEHNGTLFDDTQDITCEDIPLFIEEDLSTDSLFGDCLHLCYYVAQDYNGRINTSICVDDRAIEIPILKDENIPNNIYGLFMLSSPYFDSRVSDSRQDIKLDSTEKALIEKVYLEAISRVLDTSFPEVKEKNKEVLKSLSEKYPHLEGFFNKESVGIVDRNKSLDHAQTLFFKEQKEILDANNISDDLFEKSMVHATRVLAEYILYRNIIIEKFQKVDSSDRENVIHDLIVPMKRKYEENNFYSDLYSNNAWILDDKYLSYRSILSDMDMNNLIEEITDETHEKEDELRPDIAIVFSDDIKKAEHPVDVVIIELKKKGLNYLGNTAVIEQLKQRARRLLGYYNKKIQRMWFFGVIDFDSEIRLELKESWIPIYSGGEVYTKTFELFPLCGKEKKQISEEKYPVLFTILSFDAIWKDASSRNKSLLSVLSNSIKEFAKAEMNKNRS